MGVLSKIAKRLSGYVVPNGDVHARPPGAPEGIDTSAYDLIIAAGKQAMGERNYPRAIERFREAIALRHDDAVVHCELGVAHMKLNQYEDAADCFQLAAHFREDYADPYYNLALLAQRQNDMETALSQLAHAVRLRPEYADAHNFLGACRLSAGDLRGALESFERAVELSPDNAHFHSNLGYVLLRDLGDVERGAMHLEIALRLNATDPAIQCNYSSLLANQGRVDEVIEICDRLLAANPGLDEARLNRALALLKIERYGEAWPDYEARKRTRSNYLVRPYVLRDWQGESLTGKTLLVYAEQGLGDEIMFASCVPEVLQQAERCLLECSPRLTKLFARSFPAAAVHGAEQSEKNTGWLSAQGKVDYQIAAGSLPGFFRRQRQDFPAHDGYLRADPQRIGFWVNHFKTNARPLRVGIAWRGGMLSTRRNLRSLDLNALAPLLQTPDVHFVSLQHDATSEEIAGVASLQGVSFEHRPAVVADLDETAALICALDLVITVCSATVHLTGALGRRAWVMVPAAAEWRYLASGETMPWYPGVRMFRQTQAGDWQTVIESIGRELAEWRAR